MRRIRRAFLILFMFTVIIFPFRIRASAAYTRIGQSSKDGITVWNEWASSDGSGNMFLIVLVRNDNGVASSVYMDATTCTYDGRLIEGATSGTVFLRPGDSYALITSFRKSQNATAYGYNLVVSHKLDPRAVLTAYDCIDAKYLDKGGGWFDVYATNISPYTIQGRAMVVWFNRGQIVDFREVVLSNDADFRMYPGEVTTEEVYTDVVYDSSTMLVTAIR